MTLCDNPRVGEIYHITHLSRSDRKIFREPKDYEKYLELLGIYSREYGLDILGYCVLPDHVQVIGRPQVENSAEMTMNLAGSMYSYFVEAYRPEPKPLWEGNCQASHLQPDFVRDGILYIETLPYKMKLVNCPEEYGWSSAKAHTSFSDRHSIIDMDQWKKRAESKSWRTALYDSGDELKLELFSHIRNLAARSKDDTTDSKQEDRPNL